MVKLFIETILIKNINDQLSQLLALKKAAEIKRVTELYRAKPRRIYE